MRTNELSESAKKSLVTRIITGVVMAAVAIPALVIGGWFYFFAILAIALVSAVEIVRASTLKGLIRVLIYFVAIVFTLGLIYFTMFVSDSGSWVIFASDTFTESTAQKLFANTYHEIKLSIMMITLMLSVFFLISFSAEPFHIAYVFYFATMILVLAIGIQSFLFLRYSPYYYFYHYLSYEEYFTSTGYIMPISYVSKAEFKYGQSMFLSIYVVLGVIFNDMGAYFVGILFGKHKMNERISPKKTWEGFFGGVIISIFVSMMFALICALVGRPILPFLDTSHFYFVVILSVLMPLISDVGDFVFSSVKRTFGVKDFSNLLPGHGGILDRIDSLIFASTLVSSLIIFINTLLNPNASGIIS